MRKFKKPQNNVVLACTSCSNRNYTTPKSTHNSSDQTRMELKKFCVHCNQHTLHQETR